MTNAVSQHDSESGFSLVELAVYILVLGIISTVIATVVISLFKSEETVSGVTSASNDSQVISALLGNDIRNARSISLTSNQLTLSVSDSGSNSNAVSCVRWTIASAGAQFSLARQEKGLQPATLASGLQKLSGGDFFKMGSNARTVEYQFSLATGAAGAIPVRGQVTPWMVPTTASCW